MTTSTHGAGANAPAKVSQGAQSLLELKFSARQIQGEAEHDFQAPVIVWGDGEQSEVWPDEDPGLEERLELWPIECK